MEEYKCPICLDNKEPLNYITDCEHIFHQKCIDEWIVSSDKNNKECPICRMVILVIEQDKREVERESNIIPIIEMNNNDRYNYVFMWIVSFLVLNILEYLIYYKKKKDINIDAYFIVIFYNFVFFLFIGSVIYCRYNIYSLLRR